MLIAYQLLLNISEYSLHRQADLIPCYFHIQSIETSLSKLSKCLIEGDGQHYILVLLLVVRIIVLVLVHLY